MQLPMALYDELEEELLFDDDEFNEKRLFEALLNDDVLFVEDIDNIALLETLLDEHVESDLPQLPEEEEEDDGVDDGGARNNKNFDLKAGLRCTLSQDGYYSGCGSDSQRKSTTIISKILLPAV